MHERTPIYAMLGLIIVLLLISLSIQIRQQDTSTQDDSLTSWATIKSNELHTFFQGCRGNGGTVDVRPNTAPVIVFVCNYLDWSEEYSLSPGNRG